MLKKIKTICFQKQRSLWPCKRGSALSAFESLYDNQNCLFTIFTKDCVDRLSGQFHEGEEANVISPIYGLANIMIGAESRTEAINYLEEYYQRVTEKTISSGRNVVFTDDAGVSALSEFKLPWEGRARISHKTRLYGPVCKNYINSEIDRVVHLLRSIENKGYWSDLSVDPIRGYLLLRGEQCRFVVKGGQHRVAVLSALGFDKVDVMWQPNWPRMIVIEHSKWWPQVVDGAVSERDALDEFDRFFRDDVFTRIGSSYE